MPAPTRSADSQHSALLSARNLSVVALVPFVLFSTGVAGVILPFQLSLLSSQPIDGASSPETLEISPSRFMPDTASAGGDGA